MIKYRPPCKKGSLICFARETFHILLFTCRRSQLFFLSLSLSNNPATFSRHSLSHFLYFSQMSASSVKFCFVSVHFQPGPLSNSCKKNHSRLFVPFFGRDSLLFGRSFPLIDGLCFRLVMQTPHDRERERERN